MANKKITDFTDGSALTALDIIPAVRAGANISITGWGTMAQQMSGNVTITGGTITNITDLAVADGGTGASTAAAARVNLGLQIGTNVQAYDSDLDAVAGLSTTGMIARTGPGTASVRTLTGTANQVIITNGDGLSGNPTLSTPQNIHSTATPTFGGMTLSGALNLAQGSNIASATTTDIGAATGNYVQVTGTTTITGLGTVQAGAHRIVKFSGILTLTYNATSLILPTSANITTAAGDTAMFVSLGSGNWTCVDYTKADGTALASVGASIVKQYVTSSLTTAATVSVTAGAWSDSGVTVTITPSSSSNKVMIFAQLTAMTDFSTSGIGFARLVRGATAIDVNTAPLASQMIATAPISSTGNTSSASVIPIVFIDSPATTSATTYKLQISAAANMTMYVNRSAADTNSNAMARYTSTITVIEVS